MLRQIFVEYIQTSKETGSHLIKTIQLKISKSIRISNVLCSIVGGFRPGFLGRRKGTAGRCKGYRRAPQASTGCRIN